MRIIAGQRRGHKFDGPRASADLRPTSDMVRETIFNIVGELMPGRVAVDLFAGTGALGLEALSRGASRAIFVEKNRENVALIHRNVATLRYQDRAQIRLADAYRWGRSLEPGGEVPLAVFLDPPYRDATRIAGELDPHLARILAPGGRVIAESDRRGPLEFPSLETVRERRYGRTVVTFHRVPSQPPQDPTGTE